ncbi:MAG: hypothetical protein ACJ76F_08410, partial [Bacteroidia bacterium]
MRLHFYLFIIFSLFFTRVSAQCGPATPTFNVNLTGQPTGTWNSPSVSRNDLCCGNTNPNTCIKFVITLDPGSVGLSFNITAGAVPGGALFYQIGCGPLTALGSPICLSGVGPHILTFCKPGNNSNVYSITAIPAATGGTNVTINDGCVGHINASGFNNSTITWNSIYPGAPGAYNSYLSCTSGCATPTVTGNLGSPPYVDYVVCGQPSAQCNFATICDTVRATFNPTLGVTIAPINPTICFGQTSTTITANGSGGTPPYTYLWNNVNPSQSINVGVGTYNVQLTDASNCPPTNTSVTVTAFSVAITANAGPDKNKCSQSPTTTTVTGTVTGASGGIWSGGGGTYSPGNTTLTNMAYTPTAAELAAGQATLFLTTTGNGSCPPKKDTMVIHYYPFNGVVTPSATNVSCFGGTNGSASVSVTGGQTPYTYSWNSAPAQTTATASNLPVGTYTVTMTDALGCTATSSVTVTQPTALSVTGTVTNVSCPSGSNGSITATPAGGTAPYTYLWTGGGQTTATISSLVAGTYTVTVTDAKGCTKVGTYTVTQPAPIAITLTNTPVSCFGGNNGTASSTVTGGTSPYTYSWAASGGTAANASGLIAGTYTLTVTDNNSCTATNTVTITQPTALSVSTVSTNETCNYLNNGTATATGSGGITPYTFLWQPGNLATAAISSLSSGTYSVTITDGRGCTATATAVITEPPVLTVSLSPTNVSCFGGSNGSITATAAGGTAGYTYSWMPGALSGATISSLPIGTYTATATDSKGCTATNTVTITQPPVLTVSGAVTNVSCPSGSNGSVAATPAGGTAPYTYLWTGIGQTSATATSLIAGTYTVTVTDAKGCTVTGNYTVTQPAPIVI